MDTYTRVFPEKELSASTQLIEIEDVKLNNVFVNLQEGDMRFSDVQLGDLGGCCPINFEWAKSGTMLGTPMWSSPEIKFELPWNIATDIWSFGTLVCNFSLYIFSISIHLLIIANYSSSA
jgi:serine/threonine protein kinase